MKFLWKDSTICDLVMAFTARKFLGRWLDAFTTDGWILGSRSSVNAGVCIVAVVPLVNSIVY